MHVQQAEKTKRQTGKMITRINPRIYQNQVLKLLSHI
jgi:hypothetical protein